MGCIKMTTMFKKYDFDIANAKDYITGVVDNLIIPHKFGCIFT